jgi:hypothetical protein
MFAFRTMFGTSLSDISGPVIVGYGTVSTSTTTYSSTMICDTSNIANGATFVPVSFSNPVPNQEAFNYGGTGSIGVAQTQGYIPATATNYRNVGISQNGGLNWTNIDWPPTQPFTNGATINYANGVIVFGGGNNYPNNIQTSNDLGVTWTPRTWNYVWTPSLLSYLNGIWFVVGTSVVSYSTDNAATWIDLAIPSGQPNPWFGVYSAAYGNGKYVLIGTTNDYVNCAYSTTGTSNWTGVNVLSGASFFRLAFGAGKFVAITTTGTIAYSTDAITWTSAGSPIGTQGGNYHIHYDGTNFIIIGPGGASGQSTYYNVAYSSDGVTWTVVPSNILNFQGQSVLLSV